MVICQFPLQLLRFFFPFLFSFGLQQYYHDAKWIILIFLKYNKQSFLVRSGLLIQYLDSLWFFLYCLLFLVFILVILFPFCLIILYYVRNIFQNFKICIMYQRLYFKTFCRNTLRPRRMLSYREGFCVLLPGAWRPQQSGGTWVQFPAQPVWGPVSLLHTSGPGAAFGFQPRVMGGGVGSFIRIQSFTCLFQLLNTFRVTMWFSLSELSSEIRKLLAWKKWFQPLPSALWSSSSFTLGDSVISPHLHSERLKNFFPHLFYFYSEEEVMRINWSVIAKYFLRFYLFFLEYCHIYFFCLLLFLIYASILWLSLPPFGRVLSVCTSH